MLLMAGYALAEGEQAEQPVATEAEPEKPAEPVEPEKAAEPEKEAEPEKPAEPEKTEEPEKPKEVPHYDLDSWYETVVDKENGHTVRGDKPFFVKFYAPWCGHCKKLAPTWQDLHGEVMEEANIAKVDCTSEKGKPLCKEYGVKGYPTLITLPPGGQQLCRYKQARTLDALKKHITKGKFADGCEAIPGSETKNEEL